MNTKILHTLWTSFQCKPEHILLWQLHYWWLHSISLAHPRPRCSLPLPLLYTEFVSHLWSFPLLYIWHLGDLELHTLLYSLTFLQRHFSANPGQINCMPCTHWGHLTGMFLHQKENSEKIEVTEDHWYMMLKLTLPPYSPARVRIAEVVSEQKQHECTSTLKRSNTNWSNIWSTLARNHSVFQKHAFL